MRCESIADEYGKAALELVSMASRLEYLGRCGAFSLDSDGLVALREVSEKLILWRLSNASRWRKIRTGAMTKKVLIAIGVLSRSKIHRHHHCGLFQPCFYTMIIGSCPAAGTKVWLLLKLPRKKASENGLDGKREAGKRGLLHASLVCSIAAAGSGSLLPIVASG